MAPHLTDAQSTEHVIRKHHAYFEREAEDFDAMRRDPERVADPIRKFVYKYFLRLHEQDQRLAATLKIAATHHADWSGKRILEIGCGHGAYSMKFAEMGAQVTMVDYSAKMLEIAERNFRKAGLHDHATFILSDLRDLELEGQYDLVFATGVTDYLPKSTLPLFGRVLTRYSKELCIVSFPKYDAMNFLRWFWIGLIKKVSLSYYSLDEVEQLGEGHSLAVGAIERMPLYYVVGLTKNQAAAVE
jgi:cyclopropane fatty-acyl-phospholipid synthase-like methyltransferase